MIVAAMILFGVGAADIAREYTPAARRWIPLAAAAAVVAVFGILTDAVLPALSGIAVAAAWVWLMPTGRAPRAGLWSAVGVTLLCAASVVLLPPRDRAGLLGDVRLPTPAGDVTIDQIALVVGAVAFLIESANVIVRASLYEAHVPATRLADTGAVQKADSAQAAPASVSRDPDAALKGGRMIGPIERVLVFGMTLTAAYALLAAVLAAKGIVRFPEISRDEEGGSRAEYFLIGSLVSWLIALAAAFLVWWAFAA